MGPIYQNNKVAISQPHRWTSVTLTNGSSFDGTDKATHTSQLTTLQRNKKKWNWSDGFIIQPSTDITELEVIPYGDYVDNDKEYTDLVNKKLYGLPAGVWHEARIIKVINNTGSSITFNIAI
jgi:hypothetical protein